MNFYIVTTPKRTVLGRRRFVWAINRENASTGSTGVRAREWRIQYNKKSQNRSISTIWTEAPTEPIGIKIDTAVNLGDVIMDVKFIFEKFFLWILVSWGVKIRHFPLTLHVDLMRYLWHGTDDQDLVDERVCLGVYSILHIKKWFTILREKDTEGWVRVTVDERVLR